MAIYTKPRSEKKVAERLEASGVEVYCPLHTTIRQWSDRKKKVKLPIFPSYVFVHIEESDRIEVLKDPGVLNFVYYLGKAAVIRDKEIDGIRAFLDADQLEDYELVSYSPGDTVDIVAGSFTGQKGTFLEGRKESATLLIESLQVILKVTVPMRHVLKSNKSHT
ncbi:MAG: UpxY family transcription antiterminator [Bacteroidetes bacterium]|nr:UpxY family transcription antiterminator [Bacteroidota bacterium]